MEEQKQTKKKKKVCLTEKELNCLRASSKQKNRYPNNETQKELIQRFNLRMTQSNFSKILNRARKKIWGDT